jgi:hypothetical protein
MKERDTGSGPAEQLGAGAALTVGTRVRTYISVDSDTEGAVREAGVIVDDYGEVLAPHEHGRDWALTKRWAIALDNGALVFRDDNELERDSGH